MRLRAPARAFSILAAAAVLGACAAPLRGLATSSLGHVAAPDQAQADETAAAIDRLVPALVARHAALRARPVDVEVRRDRGRDGVYGGFDPAARRISIAAVRAHPDATLAHELVHALEPDAWSALPAVVREGLADHLAAAAVPSVHRTMRVHRSIDLALYCGQDDAPAPLLALAAPQGRLRAVAEGDLLRALYAMGLLIVDRAGIEVLERLSLDARAEGRGIVPPERVLAAARLPHDRREWLPIVAAWPGDAPPLATEPDAGAAGVRD